MDIFNNEDQNVVPAFTDLVGEGKKYSDNDAVAKALVEKDRFIQRVLDEKRQLEADLRAQNNLQAFEDRMKALEAARLTEHREPTPTPVSPPASVEPADLEDKIAKALQDREQQNIRSRNLITVKDTLTEKLGQDYPTRVKARARELGISLDRLNQIAAETPQAFFTLIGLNDAPPRVDNVAPPVSQHNPAAFTPDPGRKNYAYFQKMRKERPTEYHTPRVQQEEMKEAIRQGAAFYS